MTKSAIKETKPTKRAYTVADAVSRFCRQKKFAPKKTYGEVFAAKVAELAGDNVELDMTEKVLVALKRGKVISGRRLVYLLGQHQRELRG